MDYYQIMGDEKKYRDKISSKILRRGSEKLFENKNVKKEWIKMIEQVS